MVWKRKKAHSNTNTSSNNFMEHPYLYKESKNDKSTPLRRENKPTNKAINIYNHQKWRNSRKKDIAIDQKLLQLVN